MSSASGGMAAALTQARMAGARGEVPVGAVVVAPDGSVLAAAGNEVEAACDASAHAELLAMRRAVRALGASGGGRLAGCDLYVTLEPCAMCAGAAVHLRLRRVLFGAYDPKGGGVEHGARVFAAPGCLHVPQVVGGLREAECGELLRSFFRGLRG
ncbi:MAG: nucleoside deaminase [Rhodospirillales bacterium]|nr:nucleoside deaminase [Rhodospirillales bacterium]